MKKILLSFLILGLCLTGCGDVDFRSDDIVILFTNDISGAVDEGVTLAGVAAYKEYMETKSKYVALVDCGDAIQGNVISTASKGEVAIDVMNLVGYDVATFGNHEFDFGFERLEYLLNKANAEYICANITYTGSGTNYLADIKPYKIISYGNKKVAFIGVTTPETLISSAPTIFKENGEYVYDFCSGNGGLDLCELVQGYVDEVKKEGADYVIVLGHLGRTVDNYTNSCSSDFLIRHTHGIDALIDGHSHVVYTNFCTENDQGEYVVSAQTGSRLESLGQLIIDTKGLISVSTVSDIRNIDENLGNRISSFVYKYDEHLDEVVGTSNYKITSTDKEGRRLTRVRETTIGNFVADAYRYITSADIGYENGGGLKADIEEGTVTLRDIVAVSPYCNSICSVEVTGQEILDMLEYWTKEVSSELYVDGEVVHEFGSFPSLSGLKMTVDTSIPSSVVVDENDDLISVDGPRRVKDVMVEENGEYVPIDVNKTYTIAAHDYMIKKGGSGMEVYLANHKIVANDVCLDYEALSIYLKEELNGDLSKYQTTENRVVIE
ncbi:MAG: bifunctional UDP-sugar hydrolase/5'-nucleotidase [Erysipelotrichaceae bacterium]|nr:bifunctional UDP-sugar hydrolase/5'-nucleotidase [Erysipelotrichaceae bacterium]